jgi:hypothetical protein
MMLNNLPRARTGLLDHLAQHAARVDVERLLRRTSDLGLGGVLFVAPLVMGGRHPIGRLVFVAIASMTAVTWCLAQTRAKDPCRWHWSGAEPVCVVAVLLVILQLMSLPPHWLARLSPHVGELLPLWTGAPATESWPAWNRISLTPEATRGGLSMLLAYVLLFLVARSACGCWTMSNDC